MKYKNYHEQKDAGEYSAAAGGAYYPALFRQRFFPGKGNEHGYYHQNFIWI